jgi:predicted NBD/HSP70 family sugar kinase
MMQKYNQKFIKSRNKGRVLKLLMDKGPISRADISKELGVVRSTVSEITNELISSGLVNEGEKVTGNVGKRPTLLSFNGNFLYFVAVVISPNGISTAICNLTGEILEEDTTIYPDDQNVGDILGSTVKKINQLISKIDIDINRINFISVGSPETFSKKTGKIKWAPYTRDWVGVDLKSFFEKEFNIEIIMKDHVKLETLGEQWKSYNNISNMVYLVITRGIGAGVVIDGKIREGQNGYLGEIAFLPISEKQNYQEIENQDKNLGYFESKCDVIKINEMVEAYLKSKGKDSDIKDFSIIADLYRNNLDVSALINRGIIRTMALGISTMIILLDPEIVVLNGEILELGKDFLDLLRSEVYKLTPYKRKIVFSKLEKKSGVFGAIKNGLDWIEENTVRDPDAFYK